MAAIVPAVLADSITVTENQSSFIEVKYETSSPNSKNWIGIWESGNGPSDGKKPSKGAWTWEYTDIDLDSGLAGFAPWSEQMPSGQYDIYFLKNDGYESLADAETIDYKTIGDE